MAARTQPFLAIFQVTRKRRGKRSTVSFFRAFPRIVQTTSLTLYWPEPDLAANDNGKYSLSFTHSRMGPTKNQRVYK